MTLNELNRLREADSLLAGEGLHIGDFAKQHGATARTIFHLLLFLEKAGYPSEVIKRGDGSNPDYRHFYRSGVAAMFAKRK